MTPPGLLRRNVGATGLDPKAKARQGLSGSTSNSQSPTSNRAYPAVLRDFMGVGPWKLTNTNTSSGLGARPAELPRNLIPLAVEPGPRMGAILKPMNVSSMTLLRHSTKGSPSHDSYSTTLRHNANIRRSHPGSEAICRSVGTVSAEASLTVCSCPPLTVDPQ